MSDYLMARITALELSNNGLAKLVENLTEEKAAIQASGNEQVERRRAAEARESALLAENVALRGLLKEIWWRYCPIYSDLNPRVIEVVPDLANVKK